MMSKIFCFIVLCAYYSKINSQIQIAFEISDCGDKQYTFFVPNQFIDSINITSTLMDYENGQKFRRIVVNDSSWVDSLFRYHDSGIIAFEGVIFRMTKINNKWKIDSYMPDYYLKTYYENGSIRSTEMISHNRGKFSQIKMFYNYSGQIVYEEQLFYNDTIQGTFITRGKNDVNEFLVYKNGDLEETWYVKNSQSENPTIMKIQLHKKNKTIESKSGLKRILKATPVFQFSCEFYIGNR